MQLQLRQKPTSKLDSYADLLPNCTTATIQKLQEVQTGCHYRLACFTFGFNRKNLSLRERAGQTASKSSKIFVTTLTYTEDVELAVLSTDSKSSSESSASLEGD